MSALLVAHGSIPARLQSGHFICSRERTDHVLPTPANSWLAAANRRIYTDSVFHLRASFLWYWSPFTQFRRCLSSLSAIRSFSDPFIVCPSPCPLPSGERDVERDRPGKGLRIPARAKSPAQSSQSRILPAAWTIFRTEKPSTLPSASTPALTLLAPSVQQ